MRERNESKSSSKGKGTLLLISTKFYLVGKQKEQMCFFAIVNRINQNGTLV